MCEILRAFPGPIFLWIFVAAYMKGYTLVAVGLTIIANGIVLRLYVYRYNRHLVFYSRNCSILHCEMFFVVAKGSNLSNYLIFEQVPEK